MIVPTVTIVCFWDCRDSTGLEVTPEYDLRFGFIIFPCRPERTWIPRTPKEDKGEYPHRLCRSRSAQGNPEAPQWSVGILSCTKPETQTQRIHGQPMIHGLTDVPLSYDVARVRLGWRREISIPKGSLVPSRFVKTPSDCPVPDRALTPSRSDSASFLGGWWTRPSNWKANTAIAFAGIIGVTYGVWNLSADKEVRNHHFPRSHPSTWF